MVGSRTLGAIAAAIGVALLAVTLLAGGEEGDVAPADSSAATTSTSTAAATSSLPMPDEIGEVEVESLPDGVIDGGGTVIVVDPTGGDDAAGGSIETPLQSLGRALDLVAAGDTIVLREGRHVGGPDDLTLRAQGTESRPITIQNWPGETAVVAPTDGDGLRLVETTHVLVTGLEFEGPPEAVTGAAVRIDAGSRFVSVIDNRMHGFAAHGVGVTYASAVRIEDNVIWDVAERSPFQTSAISIYQAQGEPTSEIFDNVIRNNVIWQSENVAPRPDGQITDGNCVIIDDGRNEQGESGHGVYQGTTLVEHNVCFDNGGRGVFVYKSDRVVIRFNTLYQNLRTPQIRGGEIAIAEASQVEVIGNLVWPTDPTRAISVEEAFAVFVWGNLAVGDADQPTGVATVIDPQIVQPSLDPLIADFRLRCSSEALGAVGPVPTVVETDLAGDLGFLDEAGDPIELPADAGALSADGIC